LDESNRLLNIDWLRATEAEPHWFGLGFVQLKLNSEERLHFWHPDYCPTVSEDEVHDHRYTFNSDILKGSLTHYIFDWEPATLMNPGLSHEMIYVSCEKDKPAPVKIQYGHLHDIGFQTLTVGSSYTFLQGRFHRTAIYEPTVTYVCREEPVTEFARVIRPIGSKSVCPFSNDMSTEELWDIINETLSSSVSKPGYHKQNIKKGILGDPSKIREEFEEFMDAVDQEVSVMALVELSDLVGAIEAYLSNNHQSISFDDLKAMSNVTKRAFENGRRD
jgi:hypothetical protein